VRSAEIQKLIDTVEKRHGSIELYGSDTEEEHGTCFIVDGVPATFSVITLDGTLPPDTFDLQVEGTPPSDYLHTTTVSLAELLQLIVQFGQHSSKWP